MILQIFRLFTRRQCNELATQWKFATPHTSCCNPQITSGFRNLSIPSGTTDYARTSVDKTPYRNEYGVDKIPDRNKEEL